MTSPVLPTTGAQAIAAGGSHTLVVKTDGTLWSWGEMATGQLGTGATANQPTAVVVTGAGPIAAFAAGGDHSLAVSADGVVRAWGENGQSQLGDGATGDVGLPMTIGDAAYAWQVPIPPRAIRSWRLAAA